jgi:GYF domain 2
MKKYYLHEGATQQGPFSLEELRDKKITAATLVWFHPMPEWKPAGEIEELKSIFNPAPAPVQPVIPVAFPKQEDWETKQFYFADSTGQHGPFNLVQLKEKNINPDTAIWYDGLAEWITAGKAPGLIDALHKLPAAPKPEATPVIVPTQEDWSKKQFYFADSAGQQGPFNLGQLKGKNINADTAIWYDGLAEWITAGKAAGLLDTINKLPADTQPVSTPVIVPAQEDWRKKQFYFADNAGQQGPFNLGQLKGKNINADTTIWYDGLAEWITAGKATGLLDTINKLPAETQPVSTPVIAPAQEDWNRKQFYFADSTGQQGPFKLEQLTGKYINTDTPIWYEGIAEWTTAGKVDALKDIINKTGQADVQDKNEKPGAMKVKFSIRKEKEKPETSSGKEADVYIFSATFTLSESEQKICDEHPLFREMVFMEYNEPDGAKRILVDAMYKSQALTFTAYSVEQIAELKSRIIEASENLVKKISELKSLESSEEMEFKVPR